MVQDMLNILPPLIMLNGNFGLDAQLSCIKSSKFDLKFILHFENNSSHKV